MSFLAILLRPLIVLVILTVFAIPVTLAVKRWMPQSRLKRVLLDRDLFQRKKWIPISIIASTYGLLFLFVWLSGGLK